MIRCIWYLPYYDAMWYKISWNSSDNGLSPGRHQAIIWTNDGILLIRTLGTNFSEILIQIQIFSFKKMLLKTSSAKWRPSCLGLNVLNISITAYYDMAVYRKSLYHIISWYGTLSWQPHKSDSGTPISGWFGLGWAKIKIVSDTSIYVASENWWPWNWMLTFDAVDWKNTKITLHAISVFYEAGYRKSCYFLCLVNSTIWTPLSSVLKKADKLNLSLSLLVNSVGFRLHVKIYGN